MSPNTRIPQDPAAAADAGADVPAARATLAEAESAAFNPDAPHHAAVAYGRAADLLQPGETLPGGPEALDLLGRALEGLAVERAGLGQPDLSRQARHRAAVVALLTDDPAARGRNLELAADLGEALGDTAGAAADLAAAALAFTAQGQEDRALRCAARVDALAPGDPASGDTPGTRPGDPAPEPEPAPVPEWTDLLARAKRLLHQGDAPESMRICAEVIDADGLPDGPDPTQLGDAHLGLVAARMHAGLDVREAAIDAANALPHLEPPEVRARQALELAILLAPEQAAWRVRRQLLTDAAGEFEAHGDWTRAVRARLRLASEKAAAGELAAAHDDFDRLVTEAYRLRNLELYAEAVLHLGRSWARAGRLPEAIGQFDRVLAKFPLQGIDSPAERLLYGQLLLEKARVLSLLGPGAEGAGAARELAGLARELFREHGAPALVEDADRLADLA